MVLYLRSVGVCKIKDLITNSHLTVKIKLKVSIPSMADWDAPMFPAIQKMLYYPIMKQL